MVAWIVLVVAGIFETVWALGLKSTEGFTKLWPSVGVGAAMLASFFLLAHAARTIPAPIAYSVWVGIGVVGAWAASIAFLNESFKPLQTVFVAAIVAGVIGLKLTSN